MRPLESILPKKIPINQLIKKKKRLSSPTTFIRNLSSESGSSVGLSGWTRRKSLKGPVCFSSVKDTVYNGVIREKMKTLTGSKYCINYFPLEITSLSCTFQNTKHSALIFAHI